jgi:7-cyano-7-deazaguanine synthase
MKTVLLYSGGLDSTVLLYDLIERHGETVIPLAFDYGQRHRRELNAALEICLRLKLDLRVIRLGCLDGGSLIGEPIKMGKRKDNPGTLIGPDTVVPGRNLLFLSAALGVALPMGAGSISIASHAGDRDLYPDCREEFFAEAQRTFEIAYGGPWINRPYVNIDKVAIVKLGRDLDVPFSMTWSCYAGTAHACGKCGACVERSKALGDYVNQGMTFARRRAAKAVNE